MASLNAWGNLCEHKPQSIIHPEFVAEPIEFSNASTFLGFGQGRSYGDSCLNQNGAVIQSNFLNRFISFDEASGHLTAEAGVTLFDVIQTFMPRGFFLPVTPGTQFVTIAGAIANDVHGKNHHCAGTFGNFVESLTLLRSDGSRLRCSHNENEGLFLATIGGLGLTGFIVEATFRLIPIKSTMIQQRSIKFKNLQDYFEKEESVLNKFDYIVSWLDCTSSGKNFGRGILMAGNHASSGVNDAGVKGHAKLNVPLYFPNFMLNQFTVKAFNHLYYHKSISEVSDANVSYRPFFYPLDSIENWNRIYGRRGFFQYQFVVPLQAKPALERSLRRVVDSGSASFLAVLKRFGSISSGGYMSFPTEGYTLAMDFANNGKKTLDLLTELDSIVMNVGGRIYAAKDARMSSQTFQLSYPGLSTFSKFIDPRFSSDFWQRVKP
jgi:FAD/FMN-containing dehydrogenase